MNTATLYGSALSLYTGRARSYLLKAGIPYRETTPITAHYRDVVVPRAGGRQGVPTLELPDGTVIRDGAAIIDHFEQQSGHSFSPQGEVQNLISRLFDVIGAEGLLRPAMHYRWNFPDENLDFLIFHFETMTPRVADRRQRAEKGADRMRAAGRSFGALPDTFDFIEAYYLDVLQLMNDHFAAYPYLLGGRPSIGDFGLIAPMYGHLGRDPKPLSLMQSRAVNVFRWVERMNRPEPDLGEYLDQEPQYLADDEVPASLIALLKCLARDFVPETIAAAEAINTWLSEQRELPAGTEVARGVGMAEFVVDGVKLNALAQPYRFYLLSRVQALYETMDDASRTRADLVLEACDMLPIMGTKLDRTIDRSNNLEVWR